MPTAIPPAISMRESYSTVSSYKPPLSRSCGPSMSNESKVPFTASAANPLKERQSYTAIEKVSSDESESKKRSLDKLKVQSNHRVSYKSSEQYAHFNRHERQMWISKKLTSLAGFLQFSNFCTSILFIPAKVHVYMKTT